MVVFMLIMIFLLLLVGQQNFLDGVGCLIDVIIVILVIIWIVSLFN